MLHFFRTYQRYFFAVVTFVIVISFTFFGTYDRNQNAEQEARFAYYDLGGDEVYVTDIEEMTRFLLVLDFIPEGPIRKDILVPGLGALIAKAYRPLVEEDFLARHALEKKYEHYKHPEAPFVGVEAIWQHYLPELDTQYQVLKQADDPLSEQAFLARVTLYEGQATIPPGMMKQAIDQQVQKFPNVEEDPNLNEQALWLFGHRTVEDWFGPKFTRLTAAFVMNAAKAAKAKGYTISNAEVDAEWHQLLRRERRLSDVLTASGINQARATTLWRDVLLFKRYFQSVGNAVLVNPTPYQELASYAKQTLKGTEYSLPAEMHLGQFRDLQMWETYLDGVAERDTLLSYPKRFKTVEEVAPEFIESEYVINVAHVDLEQLARKYTVKELWKWQLDNWKQLQDKFADLGIAAAIERGDRFEVLKKLDRVTRGKVDTFSREAMLKADSAKLNNVIENMAAERKEIIVRSKGGPAPLPGIEDRTAFVNFLMSNQGLEEWRDGKHIWKIEVIEKGAPRIIPYKEFRHYPDVLNERLNQHYVKMRSNDPSPFRTGSGGWKPLQDVQTEVGEDLFQPILRAIGSYKPGLTSDLAAAYRFIPEAERLKTKLEQPTWFVAKETEIARDQAPEWNFEEQQVETWTPVTNPPNGAVVMMYVRARGEAPTHSMVKELVASARRDLSQEAQRALMKQFLADIQEKNAISLDYLRGTTAPQPD